MANWTVIKTYDTDTWDVVRLAVCEYVTIPLGDGIQIDSLHGDDKASAERRFRELCRIHNITPDDDHLISTKDS